MKDVFKGEEKENFLIPTEKGFSYSDMEYDEKKDLVFLLAEYRVASGNRKDDYLIGMLPILSPLTCISLITSNQFTVCQIQHEASTRSKHGIYPFLNTGKDHTREANVCVNLSTICEKRLMPVVQCPSIAKIPLTYSVMFFTLYPDEKKVIISYEHNVSPGI